MAHGSWAGDDALTYESPAAQQAEAATAEEPAAEDAGPVISECGAAVLQESQNAYTACFAGDEQHGACETCGYNSNASAVKNANDCITCPDGSTPTAVQGGRHLILYRKDWTKRVHGARQRQDCRLQVRRGVRHLRLRDAY